MKKYSSVVMVIIVDSIAHLVHFPVMLVIYQRPKTPSDLPSAAVQKHIHAGRVSNGEMIKLNPPVG